MHCGSFFSRRAGRADKWASTAPRGRAFACRPASMLGTATAYARRPEVWNGSIPRRHGRSAVCDEPRRRAKAMCAGMSAGTGRASGVGLGAFACATEHFLIAALRRRVATVDLARLVSCAACPSDRLELHLDIEGAEYEVCQVPSIFAVHTHTDSHNGGASFILLLRLAHEGAPATMAGAAPPACPRRCLPLPLDDGGRVARD